MRLSESSAKAVINPPSDASQTSISEPSSDEFSETRNLRRNANEYLKAHQIHSNPECQNVPAHAAVISTLQHDVTNQCLESFESQPKTFIVASGQSQTRDCLPLPVIDQSEQREVPKDDLQHREVDHKLHDNNDTADTTVPTTTINNPTIYQSTVKQVITTPYRNFYPPQSNLNSTKQQDAATDDADISEDRVVEKSEHLIWTHGPQTNNEYITLDISPDPVPATVANTDEAQHTSKQDKQLKNVDLDRVFECSRLAPAGENVKIFLNAYYDNEVVTILSF